MTSYIFSYTKTYTLLLIVLSVLTNCSCGSKSDGNFLQEEHSSLSNKLAMDIMSKYELALANYKNIHGEYPICTTIYVRPEMIAYLKIDDHYWYCEDSIMVKRIDPNENCDKRFVAIGNANSKIVYECPRGAQYKLTFIGYNGIDENGGGDDILIRR